MDDHHSDRRALAFSTGGVDTVMQLGVAHALLVARAVAPDYIVGVSCGAINATAVAEILKAGETLEDTRERLAVKTDRLREYINAYTEVPRDLADTVIPDSLEVINKRPLKPLDSPLHFAEERESREKANEAKAGLISLINDVFQIRLPFSSIAVIVRRILGCVQAGELPTWAGRVGTELRNEAGLIATIWNRLLHIAPMICSLAWSALWADNLIRFQRRSARKVTAGSLLTRWRTIRRAANALKIAAQVALVAPLLAFITAAWALLWAPFWVPLRRLVRSKSLAGGAPAQELLDRILAYYGLRDGIGATDMIKQHIVRCFDQKYYGEAPIVAVLQRALDYSADMNATRHEDRRRLFHYTLQEPKITVGIVAANVATGELEVLPPQVPVVDALSAALAIVPFLPPVGIDPHLEATRAAASKKPFNGTGTPQPGMRWYIDGANISAQAIGPLMDLLRRDLAKMPENELPGIVHVYPVNTLPISRKEWRDDAPGEGLIHDAQRAMKLKELRDATLERGLTNLYTDALPHGKAAYCIDGTHYVRANIYPIELDKPPDIHAKLLLGCKPDEIRTAVYETAAKGCMAALEQMMPARFLAAKELPSVNDPKVIAQRVASPACEPPAYPENPSGAVFCRLAIQHRLGVGISEAKLPGGSKPLEVIDAPGLPEICRHCALNIVPTNEEPYETQRDQWTDRLAKRLKDATKKPDAPQPCEWPVDQRLVTRRPPDVRVDHDVQPLPRGKKDDEKPVERIKPDHPLVSMLFGGGVFRGVFHVGVLNALNEMRVTPDVVAGASVGSIVAAMIARVFTEVPDGRPLRIARLAATFLAIDKLILTDRLADAVRRLTLRAGEMYFSLYDLDRIFRRYDVGSSAAFGARVRKIAAGIERMLYVSPFELQALTAAARENNLQKVKSDLLDDAADFLFRSGIGDEILGSEPLRVLIEHHVIRGLVDHTDIRDVPLSAFCEHNMQFFATVTNMTLGKLDLLRSDDVTYTPSLLFSLLASSAFPAVFRPRSSWEVFREPKTIEQFIDGGVMDNLPLHAVTEYLDTVLAVDWRRPKVPALSACGTPTDKLVDVPHLLFTASLEVDKTSMALNGWDVEQTRQSCRRLQSRAKTFTYNRKIDAYARVQRDIRRIYRQYPNANPNGKPPLDLHVLAVKPKWLCGTFGFHPMLGFKRWKQAASIAHGCASTFGALAATKAANAAWIKSWGVQGLDDIDNDAIKVTKKGPSKSAASREPNFDEHEYVLSPRSSGKPDGTCWFRKSALCPFSAEALAGVHWPDDEEGNKERKAMLRELPRIYQACGMARNHGAVR